MSDKVGIIAAVTNPLSYLVLGLLIAESALGTLAVQLEIQRELLIWAMVIALFLFVVTVVFLAIWRPEALKGIRPWHLSHSSQFADDLSLALEGPISNLPESDQEEAWRTLTDIIKTSDDSSLDYSAFCKQVADRLDKKRVMREKWSGQSAIK